MDQAMTRIMIDTNIFDSLVSDSVFPDIFNALGKEIEFVTTPLQEAELQQIPNQRRRALLKGLPRSVVPHSSVDVSTKPKHLNDQLIGITAYHNCHILLTNDQGLKQWMEENYPAYPVWDYQQFISWFIAKL